MNRPTRTLGALVLAAIVVSGCGLRDRLDGTADGASTPTPASATPAPSILPVDATTSGEPSATPTTTPAPTPTAANPTPRASATPVAVALPVSEVDELAQLLAEIDAELAADADAATNEGSTP